MPDQSSSGATMAVGVRALLLTAIRRAAVGSANRRYPSVVSAIGVREASPCSDSDEAVRPRSQGVKVSTACGKVGKIAGGGRSIGASRARPTAATVVSTKPTSAVCKVGRNTRMAFCFCQMRSAIRLGSR